MTATWQPPEVIFPDAEKVLVDAYKVALTAAGESGVTVDRKVPSSRPAKLVAITRDGGGNDGMRDRPRMRFRVFAPTDKAATDLARLVVALAGTLVTNGTALYTEVQSGPYEVPDQGGPMRYALIEFHLRGVPLP
jgi:hypothetical protein